MACNRKLKNPHCKSAQNAYNNAAQAFVAAGAQGERHGDDEDDDAGDDGYGDDGG